MAPHIEVLDSVPVVPQDDSDGKIPHSPAEQSRVEVQEEDVREAPTPEEQGTAPASPEGDTTQKGSFKLPFLGETSWQAIWAGTKAWLSNPFNVALLIWILAVAVSGAILFMVMVGMLNAAIPEKSNRDIWLEASNQTLNALFTLWALLVQPWRIMYLAWVCSWKEKDRVRLRTEFSRSGPQVALPHERRHMAIVAVLLNLNCLFQYCLAAVMWGLTWQVRPAAAVGCLLGLAFGCAAAAGLYCIFSPLGRPQPPDPLMTLNRSGLEELLAATSINGRDPKALESALTEAQRAEQGELGVSGPVVTVASSVAEPHPIEDRKPSHSHTITVPIGVDIAWHGHIFQCFEDWKSALGVLFCCCCSFGRNLERAGFGSKYLHTVMLIIFLAAPILITEFAALRVTNDNFKAALIISGCVLSYLGLLYGGYWRNQLSKFFRLPSTSFFGLKCGLLGDFLMWLTCCCFALCQEIRTVKKFGLHVEFHPHKAGGRSDEEQAGGTLQNLETVVLEHGSPSTSAPPRGEGTGASVELSAPAITPMARPSDAQS